MQRYLETMVVKTLWASMIDYQASAEERALALVGNQLLASQRRRSCRVESLS
jgi:hypothetical protein